MDGGLDVYLLVVTFSLQAERETFGSRAKTRVNLSWTEFMFQYQQASTYPEDWILN